MNTELVVYKFRDNIYTCDMGMDVSTETLTSQIRTEPDVNSTLLATFTVEMGDAGGVDGEIILTLLAEDLDEINVREGYMDIKRVVGGRPLPVFDKPLKVDFRGVVTS